MNALRAALEQPKEKREPVGEAGPMPGAGGFTMACFRASDVSVGTYLYTHPQPKREPLSKDRIREILMCNGFTIKDGEPDLKPYVYNAVRAILDAAQQQPVVDHPQLKREPLTDAQIANAVRGFYSSDEAAKLGFPDDACTAMAIERAHNIK